MTFISLAVARIRKIIFKEDKASLVGKPFSINVYITSRVNSAPSEQDAINY